MDSFICALTRVFAASFARFYSARPHRLLLSALTATACGHANALPLLTEIYYNGPLAGADPDEYVELSNPTPDALQLAGYRFTAGIDFTFGDTLLPAGASLVVAANPSRFTDIFGPIGAQLFDFSGGLSNSGELLALADPSGADVWSVRYDDGGAWPTSADGSGDALQLLSADAVLGDAASWAAGAPDPGTWQGFAGDAPPAGVSAPTTLALLATGLLLVCRWRRSTVI